MKVALYTLGCRLNQAETALIGQTFRERGYEIVPFDEPADVCVINTCTVTHQADSKCRQVVRQVLRKHPDTFVAVVGCYAQIGADALATIEGLDLIVGNQHKLDVAEFVADGGKRATPEIVRPRISRTPFTIPVPLAHGPSSAPNVATMAATRANLKIQDGCDFMCSFCVIPFARGRARSREFDDIRREAETLIDAGHCELVLTGVNIGTYAHEGRGFFDVVKMLEALPGIARLRISSIEPTTVPAELIDFMAESKVMCPHLHIPLQAGADTVLSAMKRHHTQREFLDLIERAAARVPDVLIATDLMVGFPGEDDASFAETARILADSPLAYAHVFRFSERTGTAAQRFSAKIGPEVKKQRSDILHDISARKKAEFYRRFIGRSVRVLTEETDGRGHWLGTADNFLKVALPANPALQPNQLHSVRIATVTTDANGDSIAWAE